MITPRMLRTIAFLFSVLILSSLQAQTTYLWSSADGNFSTPANWQPNGIPGEADTVKLASGFLNMDIDSRIGRLEMTGGILQGTGRLEIVTSGTWTGGDINEGDTLLVASSAILEIDGSQKDLNSTTLINNGLIVWNGDGRISLKNHAAIINNGTLHLTGNALLDYVLPDSGGSFTNNDSLIKSGSGTSTIDAEFYQNGVIHVQSGKLRFERGNGIPISGELRIEPSAIAEFDERTFEIDSLHVHGGGIMDVRDAVFHLLNSGLIIDSDGHAVFERNDFRLEGDGPLTVNGLLEWKSGVITGNGDFIVNGIMTMKGSAVTLETRHLDNYGLLGWESTGALLIADSAVVTNHASATFIIQNNEKIRPLTNGEGILENYGLISKTAGGGETILELPLKNYGTISILDGSVISEYGGIQSNAEIHCGTAGIFNFDSQINIIENTLFSGGGSIEVQGATLEVEGNGLTVSDSTLMRFTAGIMTLNAPLRIDGELDWSKGELQGSDTLFINSALTLSGSPAKDLIEVVVINTGDILWSGSGDLKLHNSAGIVNHAGAIIDFQSNALLDYVLADNGGWLENFGVIKKSAGNGESNIDAVFTNKGMLEVQTGKVRIERGSDSTSSGIFHTAANAILEISERRFLADSLLLTGNGEVHLIDDVFVELRNNGLYADAGVTLRLDDSQAQIEGDAPLTIDGNFEWFSGSLSITDTVTLNGTARFDEIGLKILRNAFMSLKGEATWYGDGDIRLLNGSVLQVEENGHFILQNSSVMEYGFSNAGGVVNYGTVSKYPDSSFSSIDVLLENHNILHLNADTLRCTDRLINKSTAKIIGNGTLDVLLGTFEHRGETSPGTDSGDTLGFVGRYQPLPESNLLIEMTSTGHDQLAITGIAPLSGNLIVQMEEGYVPAVGDTFEIMTANQIYGGFSNVNLPMLGSLPVFEMITEQNRILLVCLNNAKVAVDMQLALQGAWSGNSMHNTLRNRDLIPARQPYHQQPWFYNGSEQNDSLPADIVDWVLVELKNTAFQTVARKAALLKTNGQIVEPDGTSELCIGQAADSLYLVVHHRNHLPIMSAMPLFLNETVSTFNFTTDQTQAYGNDTMVEISPGTFAFPAGNGLPDDSISTEDINSVWGPEAGTAGYRQGDFNLNGEVQNNDKNLYWKIARGKTSGIPSGNKANR